jgi:hypothetical protein
MPNEDYKPRFVFEITDEQQQRCNKVLGQFGMRKAIFQLLLDDVLDMIETHGDKFVGAILSGMVKPHEVLKSMNKAVTIAEEISNVKS